MPHHILRHGTVAIALLGLAYTAAANTVVTLGSISQISGPQDLDLEGNIVYAINFSPDDPVRTVSGVPFLPDNQVIPGATLVGPQNVVAWQTKPEFGASADANALEEICADIRWANAGAGERLRATLAVTQGEEYKLQVLISGNHNEDRKWDIRVNGQNAVDEITSLGASPGQSYAQNRVTLYSYQFTAPSTSVVVEMGGANLFGANEGGDRNAIWQALTLEDVFIPPTPDDILLDPSQFFPNQTARVGAFRAIDGKSSSVQHTFELVPGAGSGDNAKFTISGNQLLALPFDFSAQPPGTTYSIRVKATDTSDATRFLEKSFAPALATPHAPTAIALDASSLSSAAQAGMVAGRLSATDTDAFDVHSFSLVAGAGATDNGMFQVAGQSLLFAQTLPPGQAQVQVRLRATDLAGLSVEHALTLPVVEPEVRINEFLAGNSNGLTDENLEPQDWIEIYNELPQTVDLTGWYLTDDRDDLTKWQFPSRTIGPNGFLILFADGTTTPPGPTGNLHVNFSLDQAGEWFGLVKPDGVTVASEFDPPEQLPNITYGLGPDGQTTGYFVSATPGAANSALATFPRNEVTFSQVHGFFTAAFPLTLTATVPGSAIRYTLDGSRPSATVGTIYSGPITIAPDTSAARKGTRLVRAIALSSQAAYSPVATNTFLFINGTANPATDGVIRQSTLVSSIINHATYGPLIDDALVALPTVSVILPSGLSTSENAASLELFDPQHLEAGFQIDCGINATGTTSLGSPKLSMAAKFRNQYGRSELHYPVFAGYPHQPEGIATEFKELRLRSNSHDTFFWLGTRENPPVPYGSPPVTRSGDAQFIRNIWIEEMQARMGQAAKHGRMVQLYLNGSYHGLYHIQEHADDDYMASYYPGTSEDFHFTGGGTTGSNHGSGDSWSTTWGQVRSSLGNYTQAKRWIDMPNLADYMILSFYAGNDWDWSSQHNWSAAGPKAPDQGGWKFFQQDSDICLQDVNANCTDQDVPHGIFRSLIGQHNDFKVLFRDRVYKHCFNDGVLTPTRVASFYNARANEIITALVAETARWQPGSTVGTLPWDRDGEWTVEWNYFKNTYFPQRTNVLMNQLRSAGWYPVAAPEFNQRGGIVLPGFEVIMTAPAGATIYYTTDGSDPRLPGGATNPAAQSFASTTATTSLSAAGAVWSYLDDGSDQGTAWRGTGFVETGWKSGPAQLGYGESDEATAVGFIDTDPVTAGVQKNLTTYFRRSFQVADPGSFSGLLVRLKRDDGAVVYLNGQEIVRTNLPGGSITFQTIASAASDDGQAFVDFPLTAGQFALAAGTNVLAVELHQADPASSDISFDLELMGTFQTTPQPLILAGSTLVRARALVGGEWSALNEASFLPPDTEPASFANFCPIEIHYHPDDPLTGSEFIEFQNTSAGFIDPTGVRISGGLDFTFPLGTVLAPGERVVVVGEATLFDATYRNTNSPYYHAGIRVAGAWSGALSNGGEGLRFAGADGAAIADVVYADDGDWPGRADGRGSSMELRDPAQVPVDSAAAKSVWLGTPARWRPSAEFHGSPGWAGTGADNRVVVNEVLSASVLPETDAIELLNTTGGQISLGGWFLSDDASNYKKFRLPATTSLAAGAFLVLREADFNNPAAPGSLVPFALSSAGDDVYLLEADPAGALLRFVDHADFGPASPGTTLGRVPNGTGPFGPLATASLGAPNPAIPAEYGAWVSTAFPPGSPPEMTEPAADPDGDRINNLAEFGLGLSPTQSDPAPIRAVPAAAGDLVFQFTMRTDLAGISVVVGVSADLATWDDTGADVEILTQISQGNGVLLVTARLKPSAASHRFVRVGVRY